MSVTLEDVAQAVSVAFGARTTQLEKVDSLIFCFTHTNCNIRTLLVLDNKYQHTKSAQNLSAIMSIVESDGTELDFTHLQFDKVLIACYEMQRNLSWGTITPMRRPDGTISISIKRRFNTSPTDLARACRNDPESELITSVAALAQELFTASQALNCLAKGIVSVECIRDMLHTPQSKLRM